MTLWLFHFPAPDTDSSAWRLRARDIVLEKQILEDGSRLVEHIQLPRAPV